MKEQFAWKKAEQFRLTAMLIKEKSIQKLSMLGDATNLNCYIFYLFNSAIANLIDVQNHRYEMGNYTKLINKQAISGDNNLS